MSADPASTGRSYDTVSRRYAVEVGGCSLDSVDVRRKHPTLST